MYTPKKLFAERFCDHLFYCAVNHVTNCAHAFLKQCLVIQVNENKDAIKDKND